MGTAGMSISAGFLLQEEEVQEEACAELETLQERKPKGEMVKVGFICNAGFGSSAMGATLFRRKLQEMGITSVDVKAYPVDEIPGDLDLAVCQRDFMEMTGARLKAEKVCTVENLLDQSEYAEIAKKIMA